MPYESIQLAPAGTDRVRLLEIKQACYNALSCQVIDVVEVVEITNFNINIECMCQRLIFLSFPGDLDLTDSDGCIEVEFKGSQVSLVTSDMIPYCLDVDDDNACLFCLGPKDSITMRLHLTRGTAAEHAKFCRFICLQQPDDSFQLDVVLGVYPDVYKTIYQAIEAAGLATTAAVGYVSAEMVAVN